MHFPLPRSALGRPLLPACPLLWEALPDDSCPSEVVPPPALHDHRLRGHPPPPPPQPVMCWRPASFTAVSPVPRSRTQTQRRGFWFLPYTVELPEAAMGVTQGSPAGGGAPTLPAGTGAAPGREIASPNRSAQIRGASSPPDADATSRAICAQPASRGGASSVLRCEPRNEIKTSAAAT